MSDNNVTEEFSAENFDLSKMDFADGQSSDINLDALKEMGIILDEGSNQAEVNQSSDEEVENLGEDASLDDIIKNLVKNPLEHDKAIEDKLAQVNKENDSEQSEKNSEELESIVYKGEEKKLSKSELRELAQKGFDYTQKTQEISKRNLELEEKIKGLEEKEQQLYSKFEEERQKFATDLNQKQQWDFVLTALEKQNPDLAEDLKNFAEELMVTYQNPLVKNLIEKVNHLESRGVEKEDQEIAQQYYRELNDVRTTLIPSLDKLGIKVDEEKVTQAWINGAETVKAAVYSIYGDQVRKLQESKIKLSAAKKKASLRKVPTASSINANKKVDAPRQKRTSYHDITRRLIGY